MRGFTLIEVLVSIIITGVMAGISMATFIEYRKKAYDIAAQAMVKSMGTTCEGVTNDFLVDPDGAAAEHNLTVVRNGAGQVTGLGMCTVCYYNEACASRFAGTSSKKGIRAGYVICNSSSVLETNKTYYSMGGSTGGNRGIDCVASAFHEKGDKVYYWDLKLGLYATTRTGPPTWCSWMPPELKAWAGC